MKISNRKLKENRANTRSENPPSAVASPSPTSQNIYPLHGRFQVLPNEDQAEYDSLYQSFIDAEKPFDVVETELVANEAHRCLSAIVRANEALRHTWLSERAIRYQEACVLVQPQSAEQKDAGRQSVGVMKDIAVYERNQAHHDEPAICQLGEDSMRSVLTQRAANDSLNSRKERDLAIRGFESQERA